MKLIVAASSIIVLAGCASSMNTLPEKTSPVSTQIPQVQEVQPTVEPTIIRPIETNEITINPVSLIPQDILDKNHTKFIYVDKTHHILVGMENGKAVISTKVITGKGTSTPNLSTVLNAVKFNPSWTPTTKLAKKGYKYTPPGPKSPLGKILFYLVNSDFVYIHHTNEPDKFDGQDLNISNGCVRVQHYKDLTKWVTGLDDKALDKYWEKPIEVIVDVSDIPVYIR